MTSTLSVSFFSREALLQRQARTLRSRKHNPQPSTSSTKLNIIMEEDETSRSSSPVSRYSPSPSPSTSSEIKARRRHANIADIRIAREIQHDDELSPLHDLILSASRPAPSPPTVSPDSFRLTFTDVAYQFPHPPTPSPKSLRHRSCVSPTDSISSLSSSPLTPVTSDDEFNALPTRRRVQPLVITKHNSRPISPCEEISLSPSLLQPYKNASEMVVEPRETISPLDSFFMGDDSSSSSDSSDAESDSEFYNRQFSKILTLCSPIPPSFPTQTSRPESMALSSDSVAQRRPSKRRVSKALPPTPLVPARRESGIFPRKIAIPNYPPPPPPVAPICTKTLPHGIRRPPPRSSVPADFNFDLEGADDEDDGSSAFSFSIYEVDLDHGLQKSVEKESPESPASIYSQPSFEAEQEKEDEEEDYGQEITVDLDYPLMLPLSLPSSPIDLEADIAEGLEKLRASEGESEDDEFDGAQFILDEVEEEEERVRKAEVPQQQYQLVQPTYYEPSFIADVFSPVSAQFSPAPSGISSFSYPSPVPSLDLGRQSPNPYSEERVLKSKWSTSTLGSIREEHERRGPSSKLRQYFSGSHSSPSRSSTSNKRSSASSKKVPSTPTSPFVSFISPRKNSSKHVRGSSSSSQAVSPSPKAKQHSRGLSASSDVMVIGYGQQQQQQYPSSPQYRAALKRRGSMSTSSDAGSEVSFSSTSSSGLRRKPIPVEMFLRATT